tara:strand:+ start:509 stop:1078 length:570 start_codon:yes stop_codon:yes gene_type:complete
MKENDTINIKSKKMMLWAAMISMTMTFAGLTSAYVVSSQRPDWNIEFNFPSLFYWSTIVIILSSFTFWVSKKMLRKGEIQKVNLMLFSTLILAATFIVLQFNGFKQIINQGYYFTGPESSISTSFIYVLVMLHLAHLISGIIVLVVVLVNSLNRKYTINKTLGFDLAEMFWHFLGLLWLFLFFFLIFNY